jgi:GNAT superfamily N-acetyltransferase/nitroimidazol reductase NimA-like FMN-containing flavoprotein (pyridoxamine 5'-phosphate oxidase superfamily)
MTRHEALRFLRGAREFHLAGVDAQGRPVLRTLNGVVVDDVLCFHASPKGEKTSLVGRLVVASVEEHVAGVPSYFVDPERACPATTLYRAVQVHGVLEPIEAPEAKARVLQALMEKLQPEGGHAPIHAEHPLYRAPVRGLLIAGLRLDDVTGKAKLAQNRSPAERRVVLERLWARGDARAVELIRQANPGDEPPPFLASPPGTTLHAWLPPEEAPEAAALLRGAYWNDEFTEAQLARAHAGSAVWVGARDAQGRLIASARVIADGGKIAWLYDVWVVEPWRGRGLGAAVVRLALDHAVVRASNRVLLGTRDAQGLYAKFGFVPRTALPPRPWSSTEMVRLASPSSP